MKMKKIVLAVTALVLLSGCSDNFGPSDRIFEETKKEVYRRIKDPESARFRDTFYAENSVGYTLCGEMNSRNGYGGYSGFEPFVGKTLFPTFFGKEIDDNGVRGDWKRCKNGTKFTW